MNNKLIVLFCLFSYLGTNLYSQKCPSSYQSGDYIFADNKINKVCYLREPDLDTLGSFFHTKYTFTAEGGKDNYTIDFNYSKTDKKITIGYFNKVTNYRTEKIVRVDPNGSLYIFKDYKQNDIINNKENTDVTLFTINEPERPYVTINQFQLMDNLEILFRLRDLDNEKTVLHNFKVSDYLRTIKKVMPEIPDKKNIDIEGLKKELKTYNDSVLNQIKEQDQKFVDNIWPKEASYELTNRFKIQLDAFFYTYFKSIFPYQNHNSRIEFTFICDADGKIKKVKNIHSANSLQIKWIEDSFKINVLPLLQQKIFETMTELRENLKLIDDFNKVFNERINNLKADIIGVPEIRRARAEIIEDLSKQIQRVKNIPTAYTYTFYYESTVKDEVWEYHIKTSKKPEVLGPVDSNEQISDDLKSKFRNRDIIISKKSKYNIKRCDVKINDEKVVKDLKQTE